VLHDVLGRERDAVGRVGARGSHEFNGGAFGHGARPFHVQNRLRLVPGNIAGVLAVDDERRVVHGQPELGTKAGNVAHGDIALAHDGDALSGAVVTGRPKRCDVVDGGEVVGRQPMRPAVEIRQGRDRRRNDVVERAGSEVVQRSHSRHHRRQRRGDGNIRSVRHVLDAVPLVAVNLRMECVLHLFGRAAEFDGSPARGHFGHLKPPALEPAGNGVDVFLSGAELLAELLRRKPRMVTRRGRVLLVRQELLDCGRLFGAAREVQQHAFHGQGSSRSADLLSYPNQRIGCARYTH